MIVKNIKFPVTYQENKELPYKKFCSAMFEIQRQIRTIKNRVSCDYYTTQMDRLIQKESTGSNEKLSPTQFSNEMYHKYKSLIPNLNTGNYNQIILSEVRTLSSHWNDVLKGERALDSFKRNQEINLKGSSVEIYQDKNKYYIDISLFSIAGRNALHIKSGKVIMKVNSKNTGIKSILDRCINGEYNIGASSLFYNKDKKEWLFSLTYKFENNHDVESRLDENKILGVDLGIVNAYYAATNFSCDRFNEVGGDIEAFSKKVESQRWKMKKQRSNCGQGSIGHGYRTRMSPVLDIGDKIARFRKHKNNLMSRKIIDEAVKLGCGTIQMEDLTGINKNHKFLQHWSYFELQTMIKNKANEAGIKVVLINPKHTSQRCSKCGCINPDNRIAQSKFMCVSCGYKTNADYNAAKNIATYDIEKIIERDSANIKQT